MNTRDLEYFMAVAERQNFSAAATQFHVSQPTITLAIKRLETEFGDTLIQRDRTHAQAHLTPAGEILQRRATLILQNLKLSQQEIIQTKATTVRFGLPPIIGTVYFPKLAGKLMADGILSHIRTREAGSDQLLKELQNGDIDIALLGSIQPLPNDRLHTQLLAERPFHVIVGNDHPLAHRERVSFRELAGERFVTLNDNFIHPAALTAFSKAAGFTPNVIYKSPDINLIKGLVAENLGISILVSDAIKTGDEVASLTIADALTERFNISLAYRQGFVPNEMQQQFINDLKALK
ncbi:MULTISPECIES: LysR family transcriptional regulator [Furfurilactobacillus]|uniref:LysR family transcriptional regulator n=1 Tax=Furfurilactobacillus milii TaxID=2888272 RepID=A0ABT6D9U2_9LACO|nr:LysR family transcriptional regulator [Furfurilactobacillus milii]QLE65591.1 Malolactic regulator [Furfurilactobacillus rossiae]MCF6161142.1 LysR family transcriptional regulator [Furfurilactobacillus milii]MCF6163603.1 LysR family transcriptional regulator [Furfurilactobacillus milii]MDF9913890.1 LysR family transcriptional regulator [Furfurilactobacillus milii]QLE68021.1 Malolactic regulator [Furfurilactobacillus rossiae]